MELMIQNQVKNKIIELRGENVLIDSDIAELYGVETKRINEAVKNNPAKFPKGYLFELTKKEWDSLKSKFSTSIKGGKVKLPIAFTEKGLYMMATILKSGLATETTLAIVETFTKVRKLSSAVSQIQLSPENSPKQKSLMEQTGQLISDLIIPESGMEVSGTETTYEMNFAIFKIRRTVKKVNKSKK